MSEKKSVRPAEAAALLGVCRDTVYVLMRSGRLGEELRTVMELLGHSTIRMTADTYGHVLPARARQAASAIDRTLGQEGTA
ncbi:helix-turn-helix domain-containing protein [Micromonospora luteifusca]|uniref:helix-turn-helix domain-containing protein n=1 Tax=Micromonospora luteifusca TaxID=709860 RepID=UPI0033ADFC7B